MSKKKLSSKKKEVKTTMVKKIKNDSLQGLEIYLREMDGGVISVWLPPRQSIAVEESTITKHVRTLQKRGMIKVI